jgi:hypothetical protein
MVKPLNRQEISNRREIRSFSVTQLVSPSCTLPSFCRRYVISPRPVVKIDLNCDISLQLDLASNKLSSVPLSRRRQTETPDLKRVLTQSGLGKLGKGAKASGLSWMTVGRELATVAGSDNCEGLSAIIRPITLGPFLEPAAPLSWRGPGARLEAQRGRAAAAARSFRQ